MCFILSKKRRGSKVLPLSPTPMYNYGVTHVLARSAGFGGNDLLRLFYAILLKHLHDSENIPIFFSKVNEHKSLDLCAAH